MYPIVIIFLFHLDTRSVARKMVAEEFSGCTVRITKKPRFESMLNARRSAKIKARRITIAVGRSDANSTGTNDQSALFKKIRNKPFKNRRNSVVENVGNQQNVEMVQSTNDDEPNSIAISTVDDVNRSSRMSANSTPIEVDSIHPNNDEIIENPVSTDATLNCSIDGEIFAEAIPTDVGSDQSGEFDIDCQLNAPTDETNAEHVASNGTDMISSDANLIEADKENVSVGDRERDHVLLIPSLPTLHASELFSSMPIESILDTSVPVDLPLSTPLKPNNVNAEKCPMLVPYCSCGKVKQYPGKKHPKTAAIVLSAVKKIECEYKQTIDADIDASDESFGRLNYSDSYESE